MSPVESMLLPRPDEDSQPFWDACLLGELRIQACASCGRLRMPPRPLCPHCRSFDHEWRLMSGRATVWSVAIPHPPLLRAYTDLAPYNVVVVSLEDDERIRLVGNVVTGPGEPLNSVDPHTIQIGDPVRVVFAPEVEGIALPRWVRA